MIQPLPLTVRWPATLRRGRVLFVLFAYHGRDLDDQPRGWLERREQPNARGHRIVHRDHYANPRTLPYLLAMTASAAELLSDQAPDVVIDRRWDADAGEALAGWSGTVERADVVIDEAWRSGLLGALERYDNVVFIYPDALGLGCGAAERAALSRHASVLVVNGRRRAFRLDGTLHGRLQWHRWLAHSRIVERALAALVQPFAARLARRDGKAGSHV